jgi:hypothetical protein
MSAYDPTDLMALCESILSDGGLSGREVYRLSQWLNENREAAQHWPGNLLVKLLQSSWSDGQITTAELQEIGRLLVKVHKEWMASHSGEVLDAVPKITADILKKIDLTRPMLPAIPWNVRIQFRTDKHGCCEIDLSKPSCTCAEWREERSQLPLGHLSRCCRHVLYAFSRLHPQPGWPGWMRAFLGHQWTPHPRKEWMVLRVRDSLVLASTAPVDWADVFAPEDGEYERFGYHVMENRWAYDSKPADSDYLRTRIFTATRAMSLDAARSLRVRFVLPPSHHQAKALT